MSTIQPIRGTHDLIGSDLLLYNHIRKEISDLAEYYDYNEIQTPIFEKSELFKKPLGEHSDVVLKEMYSFEDRSGTNLTLRPEYTTPIIRAAISNNLLNNLPVKFFGLGPMFRRERPQKGRYRQFNQINFEVIGTTEPSSDSELIILANELLKNLKIQDKVTLYINSLGDFDTIIKYKKVLSEYYNKFKNDLSDDSLSKINNNPLRILDSKDSKDSKINQDVPKIDKYYSKEANQLFEKIQIHLNDASINYIINNNLVRGLDYYCHTVFEFKSNLIGSQDTIIGGGRYDGLVKTIGGPDIPGVGWASGIERIMMILKNIEIKKPVVQVVTVDEFSKQYAMNLILNLRKLQIKTRFDFKMNIKKSLKHANEEKIKFVIIIGEFEVKNRTYTLKNLLDGKQKTISFEELLSILRQ